jgi:hypothetical protein
MKWVRRSLSFDRSSKAQTAREEVSANTANPGATSSDSKDEPATSTGDPTPMVLVFGATGRQGGSVCQALLQGVALEHDRRHPSAAAPTKDVDSISLYYPVFLIISLFTAYYTNPYLSSGAWDEPSPDVPATPLLPCLPLLKRGSYVWLPNKDQMPLCFM